MTRNRLTLMSRMLHHHVYQSAGDDDDLLNRLAADVLLHRGIREHDGLDRLRVGVARHAHVAALPAVYLHHQLDLVLDHGRGIMFRPGRVHDVADETELAPERVGDMRRDWVEQSKENAHPFGDDKAVDR